MPLMTLEVLLVVIFLVISHTVADFPMQDEKWAVNKSKSIRALLSHTFTYSLIMWCAAMALSRGDIYFSFSFWFITFVAHTITDYFTSKVTSRMFAAQKYGSPIPNWGAFTVIGIDQALHFCQIFLTYYLLT